MTHLLDLIHERLHRGRSFDLAHTQTAEKRALTLFIDQNEKGNPVAGVQMEYEKDAGGTFCKFYLEPSGNVNDLEQALAESGLSTALFSHHFAMPSRQERMEIRGRNHVGVEPEHSQEAEPQRWEQWQQCCAHESALVLPFLEDAKGAQIHGEPVLKSLRKSGLITAATLASLKAGMDTLDASESSGKFDTHALEKILGGLLGKASRQAL